MIHSGENGYKHFIIPASGINKMARPVRAALAALRRRRAVRRRPRVSRPMVTTRLGKLVRRIVNRGVEVKHVGQNVVNAAFNSSIGAASECYPILPAVTEGTDGHQRIGDRISPKYLIVKGKIHYDDSVTGAGGNAGVYIGPSTVRMLLLSQKNIKISSDVSSRADVEHLLKDNIGTDLARAYTGTQFDNLAPINKDLFTVHMDRKFKLKGQMTKELGNSNTVTFADTQRTLYFVKKIRCPKNLYFDDGNGNTPNNFVNRSDASPIEKRAPSIVRSGALHNDSPRAHESLQTSFSPPPVSLE